MALAGELAKYIGNEMIKVGGKDLATKAATSALSSLAPKVATKVGTGMATKAGTSLLNQATALGLAKNDANKWILNTSILDTDEGVGKIKDFMNPILGGDKTPNYQRFLEQIGEGEYQMGHRPNLYVGDSETKFPLSNMEADPDYLPKIYGDNEASTVRNLLMLGNTGPDAQRSAKIIAQYQNQPDKMVKIFRQAPKDMNYGDWVGLTKEYADNHIGNSPNNQLWEREVPASEVMFAGDDINEWGYYPKEVQLDDEIANELNMAIEKAGVGSDTVSRAQHFIPKRNIPVETAGDFPNSFSRVPVKVGGREMDTSRLYTGEIPELYHQTSASSLGDMTLDRRRAVSGDSGMPEGIFLKDHDEDIGLMGKNQLALNAKMERPAYFKDRADLDNFMRSRGGKDLMSRRKELDDYYQKLTDDLMDQYHKAYEVYYEDRSADNKALVDELEMKLADLNDEWEKAVNDNGEVAREGIRNTLVNNGYDSAIIENDEGSGGRSVKSYIAFDKNQLSPRYNKDINFDPNDAQSVFNEAKRRQKDLDTIMKNIAEKITAEGDKAVYKSGGNKSINSMVNKVNRKKTAGRDYRLLDMKDHMRGAVMLENLNNDVDEITNLLENMQYTLGVALDIEAVQTDLGYTGLHLTWRDDDGLGYEIQVTTPEIWDTKKASDKIYDEIRNWTTSEIDADPAKRAIYDAKVKESQDLWNNLWKRLGGRPDLKYLESFNDDLYY